MPKFMVIQTVAPGTLTQEHAKQFEEAVHNSSEVKGNQSFYNIAEGKAVWILEAQDQQALAEWFQRMEMPYERITSVEAAVYHAVVAADSAEEAADRISEGIATIAGNRMTVSDPEEEHEEVSGDDEGVFAECDWCNTPIYNGNAAVEITHHIHQVDADAITVIRAEPLLTLCARCGNRLNEVKLGKALKKPQRWQIARPTE